MNKNKKPILILLAGGSGSGKTTIAQELIKNLPKGMIGLAICQDCYYLSEDNRGNNNILEYNFDHPNAFDWTLMKSQIQDILNNKIINIPIYDYKTHSRKEKSTKTKPADVIILEGIHALRDDEINNMSELKIYVDTPKDESFIRRLERDVKNRGRKLEDVIEQWRKTVRPMYDAFVEPLKIKADLVIPWNVYQEKSIEIIRRGLIDLQKNRKNNELLSKK